MPGLRCLVGPVGAGRHVRSGPEGGTDRNRAGVVRDAKKKKRPRTCNRRKRARDQSPAPQEEETARGETGAGDPTRASSRASRHGPTSGRRRARSPSRGCGEEDEEKERYGPEPPRKSGKGLFCRSGVLGLLRLCPRKVNEVESDSYGRGVWTLLLCRCCRSVCVGHRSHPRFEVGVPSPGVVPDWSLPGRTPVPVLWVLVSVSPHPS